MENLNVQIQEHAGKNVADVLLKTLCGLLPGGGYQPRPEPTPE